MTLDKCLHLPGPKSRVGLTCWPSVGSEEPGVAQGDTEPTWVCMGRVPVRPLLLQSGELYFHLFGMLLF